LAYAQFTTKREEAKPNTSTTTSSPGVKTYVDALAALVPAEVLTLHALILSVTTRIQDNVTTITEATTLQFAFYGLLVVSAGLYVVVRVMAKKWDPLDWLRMLIPPLAFVGWTMLQRATAFDALFPSLGNAPRTVSALFLAVLLGALAAALAYQADQKPAPAHPAKVS
jgi:hypothetical protein